MRSFHFSKGRTLVAAGAAALAGSVLIAGIASAQSPSPSPSPSGSPRPSGSPSPSGSPRPDRGNRPQFDISQFAARLAQALGKPQADVERALQQVGPPFGGNQGQPGGPSGQRPNGDQFLAPVAQQLGVTTQQLQDALKAAIDSVKASGQQGQGGQRGQRPDQNAFFAAVAQQLGRGITADQVRAAFSAARPNRDNLPNRDQIRQQAQQAMDQYLQQLASALGVTVDQLKAALQQIRPEGQWRGHGPRGR